MIYGAKCRAIGRKVRFKVAWRFQRGILELSGIRCFVKSKLLSLPCAPANASSKFSTSLKMTVEVLWPSARVRIRAMLFSIVDKMTISTFLLQPSFLRRYIAASNFQN